MMSITAERVREVFSYNPDTGDLTWRVTTSPRRPSGAVAGFVATNGYRRTGIDNRRYAVHRLVWLYVYGAWPSDQIDHIDGNRLNNRLANLREATASQNQWNSKQRGNGLRGVRLRRRGCWQARICVHRKTHHLGSFATPEEASQAYIKAAEKLHGEFARPRLTIRRI
jgi:hypothetical protein